jgi:hypothetical protein
MKLEFSQQIFEEEKKAQILNFIKIYSVGAGFFHEDGQTDMTDMTKPIVAFRNFANAPNKTIKGSKNSGVSHWLMHSKISSLQEQWCFPLADAF